MTTTDTKTLRGGDFLIAETRIDDIFTPEDFSEDQQMIADMARDFIDTHIAPHFERLEQLDLELTTDLLLAAGEQGLIGVPFPEEYGGTAQGFTTSMLLAEIMARSRSFSLSLGAHHGIGMLPILYFGTDAQKAQYLPDMIAGSKRGAYCLTEPDSGSDALSAKSTATLSSDESHYVLDGQKMWITNGGFADVFVVFAKVDGVHFTGFIVERDYPGVSVGAEERKMGIKGSSTRQVFFEQVKVPAENVLGKVGQGHKIAFNILNIGRIKLAAGAIGGSKQAMEYAARYAQERYQFKVPIASFGAIQHKIGEMAARIYAVEAAAYRAAHDIELTEAQHIDSGKPYGDSLLAAAEEYAIECALLKVHGSECLDYCVDEAVQVYGGMGYSEEMPVAALYRDARINRIFEGTNEINRLLSMDRLLKRAHSGQLPLFEEAANMQRALQDNPDAAYGDENTSRELSLVQRMKKAYLLLLGATARQVGSALAQEQEILILLSDMMGDIYLAESAALRALKVTEQATYHRDCSAVFVQEAMERFDTNARRLLYSWSVENKTDRFRSVLAQLLQYPGVNIKEARRRLAQVVYERV